MMIRVVLWCLSTTKEKENTNTVICVVVVVILLVVKLVVIVPQKARVIKTFCVCVFLCVCWRIKVLLLFFPPFAERAEQTEEKENFRSLEKKYEEKLAHAFLHLLYLTLFFKSTNNNNV